METPEDYNEGEGGGDDDEEDTGDHPTRNELIYVAGRLHREGANRWIYERYRLTTSSSKFADLGDAIAKLYFQGEVDASEQ